MNELIQDTWHDLRAKRLWPVALALALAIVAIPVLLTKSAAQPPANAPVVTETDGDAEQQIALRLDGEAAGSTGTGSALDKFAEGDPFTPPAAVVERDAGSATATASVGGPTADRPTDGDGATGGGGRTDSGGGGGPNVGSPPAAAPSPPADVDPPRTRTETTEYEYVADVTFWQGERRRTMRGLRKLDMLPSQRAPVLIFMGTAGDGGNAVLLVDSTLKAAGEGRCVPEPSNCVYVHLGPGSEHAFTTAEGESYRLRVDEIRRVEVRPSTSRKRIRPSARTSTGDGAAVRRFELPSLVDLVAVSETETVHAPAPAAEMRSRVSAGGR
ncbi:MAG TPA: hypothetical protein VHF88_07815 [Thermoleophilaceae bacterium]|nr:hypothetical protein [Thermoleophilaceae bacterium]